MLLSVVSDQFWKETLKFQFSGMLTEFFFSDYLFLCLDKSVLYSNFKSK